MKKGFNVLLSSAVLYSTAFASPMLDSHNYVDVDKMEHQILFGENSDAQILKLDETEMKETEGEFIPFLFILAGGLTGFGLYAFNSYRTSVPMTPKLEVVLPVGHLVLLQKQLQE
jgi:hypothetical protein